MKRTENGKPVLSTSNGLDVVALDALAKLSGVSGGAVVRVLAALDLIVSYETVRDLDTQVVTPEVLTDFAHVPTGLADETRAVATNAYCRELAQALRHTHPLASTLNLSRCL